MYDIFFAVYDNKTLKDHIRSRFPLAKFCIVDEKNTIKDALYSAQKRSLTKMFWFIDLNYTVANGFDFEFNVPIWDEKFIHVFLEPKLNEYKGVYLIPKKYHISKREAEYVFFINKKEIDFPISKMRLMDIFFISYDEVNADENWLILKNRFPHAQRIHKVKGIHRAHIEAAKLSSTKMFWAVDGDALIVEDFNFDHFDLFNSDLFFRSVYVYQSINPINDLVYGYGGVKLLPKIMTINMSVTGVDMTTSISSYFYSIPKISNIGVFNTDPFNTWKSAFRGCVKLSSKIIENQEDKETEQRLEIWCTIGEDRPNGKYAIKGANMGKSYGLANKGNIEALAKINDWEWLQNEFNKL